MLAATTGLAQLILAVIYVVTARSTNPSEYGLAVAAIAAGTSAVGLLDFGTNSYWIREIAQSRISVGVLSQRLTGKIVVAGVASVLWVVVSATFLGGSKLWVAGPVGLAIMTNQALQVPLRGLARNDLVALNVLSDKVAAGLFFIILGMVNVEPVDRLWICLVVGSCCAAALGWLWTPRDRRPTFSMTVRANPWTGAGHYGLSTLATGAQAYDLPILGVVGGAYAAGVYGAVNRWTQPMGLLSGAFVSAGLPFMASATSFRAGLAVVRRGLWLPAAAIAICIVVVCVAPTFVSIILGTEYGAAASVLQTLALATILGIVNQPLFVFLQARRHEKSVAWLMIAGVVVQLTLVVTLGSTMGALGAAIAIATLQTILLVGCTVVLVRIWKRGE